jgi:uncharacterized protein (DUF1800 family)
MTLRWHDHFATADQDTPLMLAQNHLLRAHALGVFPELLRGVMRDPAMQLFLSLADSSKEAPNENFARELMELFTLGVNQYTQEDVVAAARAWTGHGRDWETGSYLYRPRAHDGGQKLFFGVRKAWTGPEIVDEILLGAKKTIAARFIATKLWSFFAYPNPEPAVVDAIVGPYLQSNLNIKTLVRSIFLRPEFYSTKAKRGLVRSPVEYIAAVMKGTGLKANVVHPEWFVRPMGQVPFSPPNVSGWRPNSYWISASSTWAKVSFASFVRWKVNETNLLTDLSSRSPEESVKAVLRQLNIDNAGPQTKASLVKYVQRERGADRWAERPNLFFLTMMCPEMQLA